MAAEAVLAAAVSGTLKEKVRRAAFKARVSPSTWVREAVEQRLAREGA